MKTALFDVPTFSFTRQDRLVRLAISALVLAFVFFVSISNSSANNYYFYIEDFYDDDEQISAGTGPQSGDDPSTAYRARREMYAIDVNSPEPYYNSVGTSILVVSQVYREISYNWGIDWEPDPAHTYGGSGDYHEVYGGLAYAVDMYGTVTHDLGYFDSGYALNGTLCSIDVDPSTSQIDYTVVLGEVPGTDLEEKEYEFTVYIWAFEYP